MLAACRRAFCSRRRRAAGLIAAALALAGMRAAAGILGGMGWRVNLTESEPLGFYRLEPVRPGTPIARGAMVELCPPATVTPDRYPFYMTGDCPGGGMPMFKQVAAIPGDRIRVSMASVAVNGAVLPFSSQLTHSEKWPWVHLPHQAGEVVLGPGQYWVYGGGARPALAAQSFDSRYWGPVRRVDIRRVTPTGAGCGTPRPAIRRS